MLKTLRKVYVALVCTLENGDVISSSPSSELNNLLTLTLTLESNNKAFFEAALSGSEPDLLHPHSKKELGFLRHCVTALQRSLASHSKKEFAFVAFIPGFTRFYVEVEVRRAEKANPISSDLLTQPNVILPTTYHFQYPCPVHEATQSRALITSAPSTIATATKHFCI
eukprot:scaffold1588_cov214-Alexandrium_tamarense.AAC.13